MKHTLIPSFLVFAALLLIGCSGGTETQVESPKSCKHEAKADDHHHAPDAKDLTACTELAAVPADATHCLLDLGQGKDTYWSDGDGVDPGTAGCHFEFSDDTCGTNLPERTFGELCLDDDRLVESNPDKDVCHAHGNDFGKPDVVSCSAWCAEQGKSSGKCEGGIEVTGTYGSCTSARCACM